MAAFQSRTVHSKTHRVCPIHTRNIGPSAPLSSTGPSPLIEPLTKDRSDMTWKIQKATVSGKWLRPNHVPYIPRPTGYVLSTQEILDPSVQNPVLYHHLESSPYAKAGLICHEWLKELLYQKNGCVPIMYGTFQDPQKMQCSAASWHFCLPLSLYIIYIHIKTISYKQLTCMCSDPSPDIAVPFAMKWVILKTRTFIQPPRIHIHISAK